MSEGAFTLDEGGVLRHWTGDLELITGYRASEVLGKSIAILHCDECPRDGCLFEVLKANDPQKSVEWREGRVCHKRSGPTPILYSSDPLRDHDERGTGHVVRVADLSILTELRRGTARLESLELEIAHLRRLLEESVAAAPSAPANVSLPPGFKLSGTRYRKAENLRKELLDALEACGWNKTKAAERLGITRVSVWRRMKQLGLPLEPPIHDEGVSEDVTSYEETGSVERPPREFEERLDLSWD